MVYFYATHKAEVWAAVILLTPIFCLVHYLCFGPKKSEREIRVLYVDLAPPRGFSTGLPW